MHHQTIEALRVVDRSGQTSLYRGSSHVADALAADDAAQLAALTLAADGCTPADVEALVERADETARESGLGVQPDLVATCACCGRAYTRIGWTALDCLGHQAAPATDEAPAMVLELRNCCCGNPLSRRTATLAPDLAELIALNDDTRGAA